ncbi:MAG TPA: nitrile hydratase accessory protein [Candidatus Dormibacteraeota bacterium]|nr:nitrile hydratase accessory protein [Candidatus Dormibacteraeota bacterium]
MIDRAIADSLPRKNGELVFEAPWEGRAFGMAVVMHDRGAYRWGDFRDRLVKQISDASGPYYESWLSALESLLVGRGMIAPDELETRFHEFKELRRDPVF